MLIKSIFFSASILFLSLKNFAQLNPNLKYGEVKDIDDNIYRTIKIGNQTWMAENLRTTKYRNGKSIASIIDDAKWEKNETGAWCYYENDESNNNPYGKLYNWYAVANNNKICPIGWHVPTDAEWTTLINYLDPEANGGNEDNIAGGKMKRAGRQYWNSPNEGATNSSGFSGVPGGSRYYNGPSNGMGEYGVWWSSTEYSSSNVWTRQLYNYEVNVSRPNFSKSAGFSVRCVRD
jgi:uncharacterized protein (TIGR02145 family)